MAIVEEQVTKARELLIEKIPMSKYLMDERLGYSLSEKGKIRCPVHDDSSPSFFYDDHLGTGHCFGCGVKGSVVEIHYRKTQLIDDSYTMIRAMRDLAKKYKVQLPNLYEREVSRYGKGRVRASRRERFAGFDDETMYKQKLIAATKQINAIPSVKVKMQFFKIIDTMYRGELPIKEAYEKITKGLSLYRSKMRGNERT